MVKSEVIQCKVTSKNLSTLGIGTGNVTGQTSHYHCHYQQQ